MKKYFPRTAALFLGAIAALLIIVFTKISKSVDGDPFKATISKEAVPTTNWVKGITANAWEIMQTIPITLEDGTPTIGYISSVGPWKGRRLVEYKNSYPPSIGKHIYVSGHYRDGKYWIDREALVQN